LVELGERYQKVKKFLENSQGLSRYLGSKKNLWRHLAAKRKPLGGARKGKFIAGIEAYNVLKYGDRGLSRTRDMVHQSLHIVGKQHVRSMTS